MVLTKLQRQVQDLANKIDEDYVSIDQVDKEIESENECETDCDSETTLEDDYESEEEKSLEPIQEEDPIIQTPPP